MIKNNVLFVNIACLVFIGLSQLTSAEEGSSVEGHGKHSIDTHHRNTLGVFLGAALDGREDAPAIGLEYERRIGEAFGIGAVVEYTGDDADFWVAAVPLALHAGHFKFYIAPGFEDGEHGKEGLLRLGAEYGFALSAGWEIAPQVNVDFVDGEDVWVIGLLFAKGF